MATIKAGTVKYPANKAFPAQYNEGKFQQKVQTEESLRCLATTLYLSAKEQFNFQSRV